MKPLVHHTEMAEGARVSIRLAATTQLWISQKNSVIELLKERNTNLERENAKLQEQSPDVLVTKLGERINITLDEIRRLEADGNRNRKEIEEKERSLEKLKSQLKQVSYLLVAHNLVCPYCGSPADSKEFYTVFAEIDGRELDAEFEVVTFECGLVLDEDEERQPCNNRKADSPR